MSAEPAAAREGGDRAKRQADGGVGEAQPLAEEIATEDAGHFTGNGGDHDLKGLEQDENDGGQDAPFAKRLLEEVSIDIEANQESIRRRIGEDEPGAVSDDAGGDAGGDDAPAALERQLTLR